VHIDRPLVRRGVPRANVLHPLDDGPRPGSHAAVEHRTRARRRIAARSVNVAIGDVRLDLVLVRSNRLAPAPDWRANGAVGMECVIRPVMVGMIKIEAAREGHRANLVAALTAKGL